MAFCLILGLIGNYRSEDYNQPKDLPTFLKWLSDHNHEDVVEFISVDPDVSAAVWELLESDLSLTLAEMSTLDSKTIDAAKDGRFGRLASTVEAAYA